MQRIIYKDNQPQMHRLTHESSQVCHVENYEQINQKSIVKLSTELRVVARSVSEEDSQAVYQFDKLANSKTLRDKQHRQL